MEIHKTGIIFDPRMLQHKARRKHPQTPLRIKAIMSILEEHQVFSHPKVQYIPSVYRLAKQNQLMLGHPEKYINFCRNLWPKSGHRADITVLDTYFNQKSEDAARVAVGCLLEGIDKLLQGRWQNGFAIIRPPGHHSGAKNTINGFCIYNNVAIGALYILQKWKKQKVCVIDWDIHHGDGTQHILQKNKDILFISIHRHDRGTFYPAGDQGNFPNNGQSEAKGTKINIPFNFIDQSFKEYNFQSPGDNQYLYAYHRIIQPLLKEFNPDVILISSGFDAANNDPLGGFTLTPNGYFYLTKKVLQLKKPTLVALQGGYSLDALKISSYAVVKALLGQQPPELYKDYHGNQIKQSHLKQLCSIHPTMHQQFDDMIAFHSQYWDCLKSEQMVKYTQKIKSNSQKIFSIIQDESASDQSSSSGEQTKDIDQFHNDTRVELVKGKSKEKQKREKSKPKKKQKQNKHKKIRTPNVEVNQQDKQQMTAQFYFAAGHMQRFKNFSLSNQKIHKWAYQPEINFFQSNFEEKRFAPKYYGKEDGYIVIQNLLYNKKAPMTIMDIKISRQSKNPFISEEKRQKQKKKQEKSTADKLAFRISGYTTQDFKQGGIMTYTEQEVKNILKIVVDDSNKLLFSQYIGDMIECLSQVNRKYWGTSVVLIKSKGKSVIRWIDFHYYVHDAQSPDQDLLEGLQNLKNLIDTIE